MLEISLIRAKTRVMIHLPIDHVLRAGMKLLGSYPMQKWKVSATDWGGGSV